MQCLFQVECLERLSKEWLEYRVWARSLQKAEDAVQQLTQLNLNARTEKNLEEAVRNAEIIITTTPSIKPLFLSDWVGLGTDITAIGAG